MSDNTTKQLLKKILGNMNTSWKELVLIPSDFPMDHSQISQFFHSFTHVSRDFIKALPYISLTDLIYSCVTLFAKQNCDDFAISIYPIDEDFFGFIICFPPICGITSTAISEILKKIYKDFNFLGKDSYQIKVINSDEMASIYLKQDKNGTDSSYVTSKRVRSSYSCFGFHIKAAICKNFSEIALKTLFLIGYMPTISLSFSVMADALLIHYPKTEERLGQICKILFPNRMFRVFTETEVSFELNSIASVTCILILNDSQSDMLFFSYIDGIPLVPESSNAKFILSSIKWSQYGISFLPDKINHKEIPYCTRSKMIRAKGVTLAIFVDNNDPKSNAISVRCIEKCMKTVLLKCKLIKSLSTPRKRLDGIWNYVDVVVDNLEEYAKDTDFGWDNPRDSIWDACCSIIEKGNPL